MPETVLVTGATGLLGSALCRSLIALGHPVRALHRPTSSLILIEGLPVTRISGDVLQPETLPLAVEGAEWVFHAAAEAAHWRRPADLIRTAVDGTRNVLEAARRAGVRRAVLTSSLAAMGVPGRGGLLDETSEFNLPPDRFPYGYAKRQSEIEALWIGASGLPVVIVNPGAILGPGDLHRIGGSLVIEMARGWARVWTDGGANYVHIDDVVRGHMAAMQRGLPGERYILGGENLTHREAFAILSQITGRPPPRIRIPGALIEPAATAVDLLGPLFRLPIDGNLLRLSRYFFFCDTTKSRRDLDLPPPRPFRQAAQEAYDWYRAQGVL
ncbi:MAG: NAD-dependent epimerase/dehydratase family protein [Anaerolineales bacterium]